MTHMVKFENASLYGLPYITINANSITSVTQEKTDPVSCTLRIGSKSGHFRVFGDIDQVCKILGRKKEDLLPKEY